MAKHLRAPTSYRIVPLRDGEYGVLVMVANAEPVLEQPFEDADAARAWIKRNNIEVPGLEVSR